MLEHFSDWSMFDAIWRYPLSFETIVPWSVYIARSFRLVKSHVDALLLLIYWTSRRGQVKFRFNHGSQHYARTRPTEDTFTDKCFNLKAYYAGVSGSNMALDILQIHAKFK